MLMKEELENIILALGQRRAESVRDYLALNGINQIRVTVKSYGEERPLPMAQMKLVMQKIEEQKLTN